MTIVHPPELQPESFIHPEPTRQWLIARVTQLLDGEEQLDPDENLIFYGLDSLQVMKLAQELKQHSISVGFDELASVPTINGWCSLINGKAALR
jgi:bifunctional isochorismate lyase/aryl carrier protein